jgi:hypothetical protein
MRISLLALLLCAACGDSGLSTGHEGIYMVGTWTRNATACDAEGASTAQSHEPLFYVKNESFLGVHFVNVNSCADSGACKTEANDDGTLHIGQFGFDQGSDSKGFSSHSAFAFKLSSSGMCEGGVTDSTLEFTGTTFRIEEKHFEAVPFAPSSGDDECPDAKVEQAAAGQPCTEFEVVTASFTTKF